MILTRNHQLAGGHWEFDWSADPPLSTWIDDNPPAPVAAPAFQYVDVTPVDGPVLVDGPAPGVITQGILPTAAPDGSAIVWTSNSGGAPVTDAAGNVLALPADAKVNTWKPPTDTGGFNQLAEETISNPAVFLPLLLTGALASGLVTSDVAAATSTQTALTANTLAPMTDEEFLAADAQQLAAQGIKGEQLVTLLTQGSPAMDPFVVADVAQLAEQGITGPQLVQLAQQSASGIDFVPPATPNLPTPSSPPNPANTPNPATGATPAQAASGAQLLKTIASGAGSALSLAKALSSGSQAVPAGMVRLANGQIVPSNSPYAPGGALFDPSGYQSTDSSGWIKLIPLAAIAYELLKG